MPTLKEIAMTCETFAEFREKREKHDRLFRGNKNGFTKNTPPRNLQEIAHQSLNFTDYLNRAHEGE